MASYFRRGIAKKIMGIVEETLCCGNNVVSEDMLSSAFKISRFGRDLPQLVLPWNKFLYLKPELNEAFNPKSLIAKLKNQGLPSPEGISDISMSDQLPLGIMFTLDRSLFTKIVLSDVCLNIDVISKKSCLFHNVCPQNVFVEYSKLKFGKPFHMGHFRSMIYTNFVANINKYVGHTVTRLNFIEDWGFDCGLLVAGFQLFGSEEQFEKNPCYHMCEVLKASSEKYKADEKFKEMVTAYLQSMKEGNKEILSQWKRLRDPFLKQLTQTYRQLGIDFDEVHTDSMYAEQIIDIMNDLEEKQLLLVQNNESNIELKLSSDEGNENDVIVTKSIGSLLYTLSRNIAVTKDVQNKYGFDAMYFVSNSSDKGIFLALFKILKALGFDWHRNMHVIRVKNINFLDKTTPILIHDVLRNARLEVLRKMKSGELPYPDENADEIASDISTASLIVYDMQLRKNREYEFKWNLALSDLENTGIYLQLCHAALTRIQEQSELKLRLDADISTLREPEAFRLVQHLSRFDEIVFKAYTQTEPCLILQYLFTLCYLVEKAAVVLIVDRKLGYFKIHCRLLLFHASQKVLGKGLSLLGIKPVERI